MLAHSDRRSMMSYCLRSTAVAISLSLNRCWSLSLALSLSHWSIIGLDCEDFLSLNFRIPTSRDGSLNDASCASYGSVLCDIRDTVSFPYACSCVYTLSPDSKMIYRRVCTNATVVRWPMYVNLNQINNHADFSLFSFFGLPLTLCTILFFFLHWNVRTRKGRGRERERERLSEKNLRGLSPCLSISPPPWLNP